MDPIQNTICKKFEKGFVNMDLWFDIKNSSYDNLTIILKPGAP
jgi:hypothetical protein